MTMLKVVYICHNVPKVLVGLVITKCATNGYRFTLLVCQGWPLLEEP